MDTSSNLSSDTIFEILTRVSLETLDTCKAVCKEWEKLIHESDFMPSYCKRTNNISGYYIQHMVENKPLSKFISINHQSDQQGGSAIPSIKDFPKDMQILATSNQGIICCLRRRDKNLRYFVGKPSTNQWTSLPNPKTRYLTISVGLIILRSNPLKFKIIRISLPHHWPMEHFYRSEIFDSTTWTWKESKHIILPENVVLNITSTEAVNASGSIHWLTNDDNVLVFDANRESFSTFPLPEPIVNNERYEYKKLLEYQGRLGFRCITDEQYLELWVMEDSKSCLWKKIKMVDMNCFIEEDPLAIPAGFYNGDIAFLISYHKVIFYRLQDRKFDVIEIGDLGVAQHIFPFRSDFEPTKLSNRC